MALLKWRWNLEPSLEAEVDDKGYRMVFASICEHASAEFSFASTSNDQICLANSEHFRKYNCGEQRALRSPPECAQ